MYVFICICMYVSRSTYILDLYLRFKTHKCCYGRRNIDILYSSAVASRGHTDRTVRLKLNQRSDQCACAVAHHQQNRVRYLCVCVCIFPRYKFFAFEFIGLKKKHLFKLNTIRTNNNNICM